MAKRQTEPWRVRLEPEVKAFWTALPAKDAERFAGALDELRRQGPALRRPLVGAIRRSRHNNMKELIPHGTNIRVLFAFDPRRRAIMLAAGDKTNDWKGWYVRNIPLADARYDRHLRSLGKEGAWTTPARATGRRSAGRGR